MSFYDKFLEARAITTESIDARVTAMAPYLYASQKFAVIMPLTMDDVKKALLLTPNQKSQGPDGYNSRSFKSHWFMIRDYICKVVLKFFSICKNDEQMKYYEFTDPKGG